MWRARNHQPIDWRIVASGEASSNRLRIEAIEQSSRSIECRIVANTGASALVWRIVTLTETLLRANCRVVAVEKRWSPIECGVVAFKRVMRCEEVVSWR